jgi:hypothetical protein
VYKPNSCQLTTHSLGKHHWFQPLRLYSEKPVPSCVLFQMWGNFVPLLYGGRLGETGAGPAARAAAVRLYKLNSVDLQRGSAWFSAIK